MRLERLVWAAMKDRCLNSNHKHYHRYGGRGIKVCDRWLESFENFIEDMGVRPTSNHSLDRYPDNDGNYEPSNCRWATVEEQQNNRSDNVFVEYNGEKITVSQLARKLDLPPNTLGMRLRRGIPVLDAIGPLISHRKYEYDGLSMNLHQWARRAGIGYIMLRRRIAAGMTIEEATTKPKREEPKLLTMDGVSLTMTDWARRKGMSPGTLRSRLLSGQDLRTALDTPSRYSTSRKKGE